jgi:hypothetical protein
VAIVKLWMVETTIGTRIVVYAEDATAAAAAVRAEDRPLVCGLREWPANAPFRVAFMPATPVDEDGATRAYFWDGMADWGEQLPPATDAALGDVRQAARDRDQHEEHLKDDHVAGGHEPGTLEECLTCLSLMCEDAMERRKAGRSRYDA